MCWNKIKKRILLFCVCFIFNNCCFHIVFWSWFVFNGSSMTTTIDRPKLECSILRRVLQVDIFAMRSRISCSATYFEIQSVSSIFHSNFYRELLPFLLVFLQCQCQGNNEITENTNNIFSNESIHFSYSALFPSSPKDILWIHIFE